MDPDAVERKFVAILSADIAICEFKMAKGHGYADASFCNVA